jgi:hypothetical protein
VEEQRLDVEASFLRLRQFVFDHVEVAVVDVHAAAVDREPRAALKTPPPQAPISETSPSQPVARRAAGVKSPR